MKTLLIPALALALACLPARAQETAAPKGTTPAPANVPAPASPVLRNTVQLEGATLTDVISYLNLMLKDQGADPLNVVVSSDLDKVAVPAITLRNVSASDVLNVVTKVAGLSLEPVLSDSGRVAAWIIAPPRAASALGGMALGMMGEGGGFGGRGGGGGGTELGVENGAANPAPVPPPPPGLQPASAQAQFSGAPSVGNNFAGSFMKAGVAGAGGAGNVTWIDPAPGAPAPAQINRVLGISRIYADITNENERAEKEAMLVKMLREITEEQNLHCDARLYAGLHVIVVKGSPDAVELVEQTISALKENAGAKKSEGSASKFSSGLGIKN